MSYEPRSRGIRSRRSATKKKQARGKQENEENTFFYQEPVPVDSQDVSARTINALEHLGNQRFVLPPFSEHFQRWMKDIESVMKDLQESLPEIKTAEYDQTVSVLLSSLRNEFNKRIDAEKNLSSELTEMQKRVSVTDLELADLDKEHRNRINDKKRGYAKSMEKLQGEIDALDEQRLRLLRQKSSIFERIFGRSKTTMAGNMSTLESKKTALEGKEKHLNKELKTLRVDYEAKRREVSQRETELREKLDALKANRLDDALELRKDVCNRLSQLVAKSVDQLASQTKGDAQ